MKTQYLFFYGNHQASAVFEINENLTDEKALEALNFFKWDWSAEEDVKTELLKKYALEAIKVATFCRVNERGVQQWFKETEGFLNIDGSEGIELKLVDKYDFLESNLTYTSQDIGVLVENETEETY